jgi:hypothetical protein
MLFKKNTGSNIPVFLIGLYVLLVGLDLYTTYLATPNLQLEANYIIKLLNLNWPSIIIGAICFVAALSIAFVISTEKIRLLEKGNFESFQNKIAWIIIGVFFSHLLYSGIVSVNNFLSYFYLTKYSGIIGHASIQYINFTKQNTFVFYSVLQISTLILGFATSYFYCRRMLEIKNYPN